MVEANSSVGAVFPSQSRQNSRLSIRQPIDLRDSSVDNRMAGFKDPRWETIIRPLVPELVETILTDSCMNNFFKFELVTVDETEHLLGLTNKKAASHLLVRILPCKGRDSYVKFLKALEATEGQEDIARLLKEKESNYMSASERAEGQKRTATFSLKKEKKSDDAFSAPERVDSDQTSQAEEKLEKKTIMEMSLSLENIALRIALALKEGKPFAPPSIWETISVLPVQGECDPYNAAVYMNKELTVRHHDWMHHWHLDQKNWDKFRVTPLNINLRNFFRCGNRCLVIGKDFNDKKLKLKLYQWVHSELQRITVLPQEHQLDALSAIGDERNNVYIVGGEVEKGSYSKRVSCYNLDSNLWETMPDMPTGRKWCSLAILDNSLYVGGGDTTKGPSNLVECLPLSTERDFKWDTLPSTTVKDCKLAAFCGKIVATGGQYRSTVFEVYDETDKAWLQLPPLNVGRSAHGVCVSGNVLLVVGGHRAENSIEAFAV